MASVYTERVGTNPNIEEDKEMVYDLYSLLSKVFLLAAIFAALCLTLTHKGSCIEERCIGGHRTSGVASRLSLAEVLNLSPCVMAI